MLYNIHYTAKRKHLAGLAMLGLVMMVAVPTFARPYGVGSYGICSYNSGGCTISLSTSDTILLDVSPTPSGVYTIQSDGVEVITDSPVGYNLSLESGSSTVSALENDMNTIGASSGTPSSPVILDMNSWGYRVDGYDNFGAGPTIPTMNASFSPTTFAGLPLGGSPQTIHTSSSSATSGETTNVWYGVAVNNSKPSGTYSQTIIYTATATP